ncbi:glycerol-3-phosphate acyltransferase, partial [Rhizobium leguminosarum]|nr:glycerol-3-phosphate acyltransferase [Rhizobium leguminosarum]
EYVYKPKKDWLNNSYKLLKLIKAFATKSSSITVSIGQPMDVLGNKVDGSGSSYDMQGEHIDLYQYFREKVQGAPETEQENKEYTKILGQRIVESYRINNCVLTSCLLAFTAFELMRNKYANISLKDFLNLSSSALTVSYTALEQAFIEVRKAVLMLEKQGQIRVSEKLQQGTIANMIVDGFSNLGLYHHQIPLLRDRSGDITTRDICSLLYYHNRLTGYG